MLYLLKLKLLFTPAPMERPTRAVGKQIKTKTKKRKKKLRERKGERKMEKGKWKKENY